MYILCAIFLDPSYILLLFRIKRDDFKCRFANVIKFKFVIEKVESFNIFCARNLKDFSIQASRKSANRNFHCYYFPSESFTSFFTRVINFALYTAIVYRVTKYTESVFHSDRFYCPENRMHVVMSVHTCICIRVNHLQSVCNTPLSLSISLYSV